MERLESTVKLIDAAAVAIVQLREIQTARVYLETLIQLHQRFPRPYRIWKATKFSPKTGKPVAFKWKRTDFGQGLFLRIYTHHGFCQDLPRSPVVERELDRIVRSGKNYAITGFSVAPFTSAYNGGAVVAGLEIKPLHRPEEL